MTSLDFRPTPDKTGSGLFAHRSFLPNEPIAYYGQLAKNVYLNNSHDPNAKMLFSPSEQRWYLLAKKVIKRGKEITIQYQHPMPEPEKCLCGSKNCSGWIGISKEGETE